MAPQKGPQAGHSADVTTHESSGDQWVMVVENDPFYADPVVEIASSSVEVLVPMMVPKQAKKPRAPRKQHLHNRLVVKGFSIKEIRDESEPSKKKVKNVKYLDEKMARLEQLVFKDSSGERLLEDREESSLEVSEVEVGLCEEVVTSLEREWCREGNAAAATLAALDVNTEEENGPKPVWEDEDDKNLTVQDVLVKKGRGKRRKTALPSSASKDKYGHLLQQKFEGLMGTPKWAELERLKPTDGDEGRHCGDIALGEDAAGSLAPTKLSYTRLTDLTEKGMSKRTIIMAVDFHPKTPVAVVANRPGLATFYQVDGQQNARLQSVMFENFPVTTAKFTADGKELLLGSEFRAHLQSYDMATGRALHIPCPSGHDIPSMGNFVMSPDGGLLAAAGRDGTIALLTGNTRELVGTFKMSGKCFALSFNSTGSRVITYGKEGQVYIWDVGERRCWHKFRDEGCLQGLSLAVSPQDRYLACGSGSGVVNIYQGQSVFPRDYGDMLSSSPRPSKAIMNLTTAAHQVIFNSTAEILATVSRTKDSAIKLVHLPSLSVYANFPIKDMEFARPEVVAFSPNSGFMAVGNNIGAVRLIRLNHFANY